MLKYNLISGIEYLKCEKLQLIGIECHPEVGSV